MFPSEIVINLIDPMQQDPGTRSTRAPIAGAAPKTSATAPTVPGVSASAVPSLGTVNTNVAMPRINTRAAWGADESMRPGAPQYQSGVKALVIHHSAGSNSYACSEVPAMMRGLYAYAVQTLGWDDIAYNFTIDKCGGIWESAAGGIASSVASTHAGGFNDDTQGVSLLGNYDVVAPSSAMIDSLVSLLAWKAGLFTIDAAGTTTLTQRGGAGTARWTDGYTAVFPTIFGHRTAGPTLCPGEYVVSLLPSIIARTAQASLTQTSLAPSIYLASGTPGAVTGPVAFGDPGDVVLLCDWNGDGVDTISVFRRGTWYVRGSNSSGIADRSFGFGNAGDQPLCGDWDGDGRDSPGVFRAGRVFLKNQASSGYADGSFAFGAPGDVALAGDWNGDGYDTLGVARPGAIEMRFYLTNSNLYPTTDGIVLFGNRTDTPVAGDWNGDGFDTVGVFRGSDIYLTDSNLRPDVSVKYRFGNPPDRPVSGDLGPSRTDAISLSQGY